MIITYTIWALEPELIQNYRQLADSWLSHKPNSRLPSFSSKVTFPATDHCCLLTKLYCLVSWWLRNVCEQLAQSYMTVEVEPSSVVVLEESPRPRTSSRTNLQVLVLISQVLGPQRLRILQAVRYVWTVWSFDVHKFCYRHHAWGYGEDCHTFWCQILLIYVSN